MIQISGYYICSIILSHLAVTGGGCDAECGRFSWLLGAL